MNNDLISRSELKKAYFNAINETSIGEVSIIGLIDNAPTINPERPQGEWGKWNVYEIRCPECLEYFNTDCYSKEELNKCPNCGAEMKGGADK